MSDTAYILGLDLHGTLLEPGEILREEYVPALSAGLKKIHDRAYLTLCTGNDLEFVDRKVPRQIRECFHGYVLETGCSTSDNRSNERVITGEREQRTIKELDALLRKRNFPEINYFAHRLTTISMFCDDPKNFFKTIADFVKTTDFASKVQVTYSSVAVDVLPAGYNKYKGLAAMAQGRKTIGVADSMNDAALLIEADHSFAPANLPAEVKDLILSRGLKAKPLSAGQRLEPDTVLVAASTETRGVIEILKFLDSALPFN